jgi:predicted RNase H-like HicB family nuclease
VVDDEIERSSTESSSTALRSGSSLAFLAKMAKVTGMHLAVETEQESDGRWLAEIPQVPGVMAYGGTRSEAIFRAQALALRVFADRLEGGEAPPELEEVFSVSV